MRQDIELAGDVKHCLYISVINGNNKHHKNHPPNIRGSAWTHSDRDANKKKTNDEPQTPTILKALNYATLSGMHTHTAREQEGKKRGQRMREKSRTHISRDIR